jgi:CDP-glycerol glycerophosphotransferase (TagB/SpsB family)
VFRLADRVLQRLVRPKPDQVVWVSDPDYIGNAFHLYRHTVTTRPGLEHVWLVVDPAARERIARDLESWSAAVAPGSRVRVLRRHSPRGYWAYLRSRRVFHSHGVYPMVSTAPGRHVVSLWHGMPIKCVGALNTISPNPYPTFGTRHLATSELFRYVIAAAFHAPLDRVLLTGLPRCDVLTSPHPQAADRAQVLRAFGVPADRRLVLWTPTYRADGSARSTRTGRVGFRSFLDELTDDEWKAVADGADRHGCTVVVKLHPHDPLNGVELDLGFEHVRLVRSAAWLATGIELYDALAHVDALMSDVSSVLIDLLVTDTPLGIIGFDPDAYTRDVVFPVASLLESERIHDLSQPGALDDFFARAAGLAIGAGRDDLSPWLYDAPGEGACDRVLAAAEL